MTGFDELFSCLTSYIMKPYMYPFGVHALNTVNYNKAGDGNILKL